MNKKNQLPSESFDDAMLEKLEELQEKIGYTFRNTNLLIQALTHKSFAHENDEKNNERLEFLGDAILQFVMSDHLVACYRDLPEGMLSKFRAVLVSEKGLSKLAQRIELGRYLFIGKGEEITGGREKSSILSDAVEALFSAIYLDSKDEFGVSTVTAIIRSLFEDDIVRAEETFASVDHKTDFQEYVQKNKLGPLCYRVIEERGPDHDKIFVTALMVGEKLFGIGTGKSKKISEQHAAVDAFRKLREKDAG